MKYIIAIAQTGLLALLYCLPAQSATVYKTVDEAGVVSFSDTKPAGDTPTETLKINAPAPAISAEEQQQRLQDMSEATDRMAADRMAREKHRAELRQQQEPQQAAPQQPDYTDYMGYSAGGSGYRNYPIRRPGLRPRPKPEHPIARPPVRARPRR